MKIPIIYYHSIAPKNPNWNRNFLSIEPELFEIQLKYFKKRYKFITIDEYYQLKNQGGIKNNYLLLTIDDGFLDNWLYAFPILKKLNIPATIFVSPEMVDKKNTLRVISDNMQENFGYMSWDEMRVMEQSGLINIQSHTMSHTKYFSEDELIDFHHPGADCLYPIGNLFPDAKSNYLSNPSFEKLIPYGYPFFKEKSSVITKKTSLTDDFVQEILNAFSNYNFSNYNFSTAYKLIEPIYLKYKSKNQILSHHESEDEYLERLKYEIIESKRIIETKLNKKVNFLCWPHGDNNEISHKIALDAGYKATTIGKANVPETIDRIGNRIGVGLFNGSIILGLLKANLKIMEYNGNKFGKVVKFMYNKF